MWTVLAWCVALGAVSGTEGLVAEYKFDTVIDDRTDDSSGKGNNAQVHGAVPCSTRFGNGLAFDGQNDYVDCGAGTSLDLRKRVSVECWVRPDVIPATEVGVAGKGIESYGLTYYKDGQCWWYISGGGNMTKAGLAVGFWNHVTGTYDGSASRLYVNGDLRDSNVIDVPIAPGGPFFVGARGPGTHLFRGAIAGLRVYDRALSKDEVAERYARFADEGLAQFEPIAGGHALQGPGYLVRIAEGGGIQVEKGNDLYRLGTTFSYPGPTMGWNALGILDEFVCEPDWEPSVAPGQEGEVSVIAAGSQYSVERTVRVDGHRLVVTDTVTNTGDEDVAVVYRNQLSGPSKFEEVLLGGAAQAAMRMMAENPTAFLRQPDSTLGWVAEDNVLRLQLAMASANNCVRMSADRFALRPAEQHTFRWVLYPASGDSDYWAFINQLRRDWDVNTTVQGPFDYFSVTEQMDMVRDAERLEAYLARKKLGVVAFHPWVDYDNYNSMTGKPTSREELRAYAKEAMAAIKRVDPEILCIGCIEGNLVSLPPAAQKALWDSAPGRPQNQYILSEDQMALLAEHDLPWQDCLLQDREGRCRYELYYRGDEGSRVPMIAIAVYAAPENGQHRYWLDQAKFLLEECGFDGLYIDQFSMAFNDSQRYSYDAWDGTTVDVDNTTGRIVRRYTDAALVGIGARRDLADYVLSKSSYMLANTFPAAAELQSVPMHRFNESEGSVNVFSFADGEKPPLSVYPCKGHLTTPVALGLRAGRYGDKHLENYARIIMKGAIAYLRHGLLYYHYGTEIPETGPGSGEYGAINHMFPLTPVELHDGWVLGEERTVTCVSGTYAWANKDEPNVLVFDITGRPVSPDATVTHVDDGWRVELRLKDWAQIAVLE
jgi:Concanavalin A-like lectin/glucanases superfamily